MAKVNSKEQKKSFPTVPVVGGAIVLVGVLIIVLIAFAPAWRASGTLGDKLDTVKNGALLSTTVYDPNFGNDLTNRGGTEKVISGDSAVKVRELFSAATADMKFIENGNDASLNDYDYRLRFSTDSGSESFFIKDGRIYYVEGTVRQYFAPKNTAAFDALISQLKETIEK